MNTELITHIDSKSPVSEAFKALRTNVQFTINNEELRTILVTSPLPEDGKSWVASNLANSFAQMGKKVVIVDADMRKGRQNNIFGVPKYPGLSNYLLNMDKEGNELEGGIDKLVKETKLENLYILVNGNKPSNPSELIVSEKMNDLIEELKEFYDIIVFDGTPSIIVTDAIILSRNVDATIIVTSYDKTKIKDLEKVKKDIQNVGGNIAGVVVNKKPIKSKRYRNSYYY